MIVRRFQAAWQPPLLLMFGHQGRCWFSWRWFSFQGWTSPLPWSRKRRRKNWWRCPLRQRTSLAESGRPSTYHIVNVKLTAFVCVGVRLVLHSKMFQRLTMNVWDEQVGTCASYGIQYYGILVRWLRGHPNVATSPPSICWARQAAGRVKSDWTLVYFVSAFEMWLTNNIKQHQATKRERPWSIRTWHLMNLQ